MITVANRRTGAVGEYIGRPSPLGNPFMIGRDGTRDEVIAKYRVWLNDQLQINVEEKARLTYRLKQAEGKAFLALKGGDLIRLGLAEKATEAAVNAAVAQDEDVLRLSEKLAVRTGYVDRLRNLQKSFQGKLELVRSNEATRRKLVED